MGRGLVGHHIDRRAAREQLREDVGAVAEEADRQRCAGVAGRHCTPQRVVEIGRLDVEIARRQPPLDPRLVDLDADADAAGHRHGQRLRAAHAAEPRGERDRSCERAAESLRRDRRERLVGALQDPLCADVDPGARRHLTVHRQAERLETAELFPGRPLGNEIAVRDQHARGPLVGLHDPHRLARLYEERLVPLERAQLTDDRVERRPRTGRTTGAAVDDQVLGALRDLGIEVIHQHPQGGFLLPALAGQAGAAWCSHLARSRRRGHPRSPPGGRPGRSQRQPTAPPRQRLTAGHRTATIGA